MNKRIAVLTGGGDVPGLNMCLKSLVYRLIDLGFEPLGVRKGWEGLIQYNRHDPSTFSQHFIELSKNRIRAVDQTSGSFLHSSRVDPRRLPAQQVPTFLKESEDGVQDVTNHIASQIEHLGVDALVVLGDDDMLRYASHLSEKGVPLVAIPKTIHNNISGTEYTLGFSTGLARGVDFVHQLRALAGSREQIVVIETFGDHSGYSALLMAYVAGVDRVLIPEVPYDPMRLAYLVQQDKNMTPSNYAILTVTNGSRVRDDKVTDAQEHLPSVDFTHSSAWQGNVSGLESSGIIAAQLLQNLTGEEVFFQQLTYLMRTGAPDGQDLLGAINFGMLAANLVQGKEYGRMVAFQRDHAWTAVDLETAMKYERKVDVQAWYDDNTYKPTDGLIWSAAIA